MNTKIFHANNCALYFSGKYTNVLIDGLYCGGDRIKKAGMSPMPADYINMAETGSGIFKDLDLLLFTHNHPDHYDLRKICDHLDRNRELKYFAPEDPLNNICISDENGIDFLEVKDLKIDIIKSSHIHIRNAAGKTPHNCYMLNFDNECFFIAADAVLNKDMYLQMQKAFIKKKIKCAFVNIIQIMSADGQEFNKMLAPEHVVLYHVPETEDDTLNYLAMIKYFEKHCPEDMPPPETAEHMSWLKIA